jgi:acetate kinase
VSTTAADGPGRGGAAEILVCNAGSSSLKWAIFRWSDLEERGSGSLRWDPGEGTGAHGMAAARALGALDLGRVVAVGHRVVHGGGRVGAAVLDGAVRREIADLAELAPLHNPAALQVVDAVAAALPGTPQVAAFDTAFHRTLPPAAAAYPLPAAWRRDWGIVRFGFHGLSHAYAARRIPEILGLDPQAARIINCHLGSGCSLCAIAGGHSLDTTMGFTPLDGIPMASRPGALDPGILLHVLERGLLDLPGLRRALEEESGLRGLSGLSGDMEELLQARARGHPGAELAVAVFTRRVRQGIAAMASGLDGLDAIGFTGGIGTHAAVVRGEVLAPLAWLGIHWQPPDAAAGTPLDREESAPGSRVRIAVFATREEWVVAEAVRALLPAAAGSATG